MKYALPIYHNYIIMEFAAYPMLGKIKKAVKVLVPLKCTIICYKNFHHLEKVHIFDIQVVLAFYNERLV